MRVWEASTCAPKLMSKEEEMHFYLHLEDASCRWKLLILESLGWKVTSRYQVRYRSVML